MKFDVLTGETAQFIFEGYVLLYNSEGHLDRDKTGMEIVRRNPQKVAYIRDEKNNFKKVEYDSGKFHLGVFPGKKEEFLEWLVEKYTEVPKAAKHIFE